MLRLMEQKVTPDNDNDNNDKENQISYFFKKKDRHIPHHLQLFNQIMAHTKETKPPIPKTATIMPMTAYQVVLAGMVKMVSASQLKEHITNLIKLGQQLSLSIVPRFSSLTNTNNNDNDINTLEMNHIGFCIVLYQDTMIDHENPSTASIAMMVANEQFWVKSFLSDKPYMTYVYDNDAKNMAHHPPQQL